jgi:hypothetical protein
MDVRKYTIMYNNGYDSISYKSKLQIASKMIESAMKLLKDLQV